MSEISENMPLSRKEREKKARQAEILTAAQMLFAQKGYHSTTLEEIAHKAEFAKGTIYNYFANKDELFFGIVDSIFDSLLQMARSTLSTPGVNAREKLRAYAMGIIRYTIDHSDLVSIMMREAPRPAPQELAEHLKRITHRDREIRGLIANTLIPEMNAGTLRQLDPARAVLLFEGMLKMFCVEHVKDPIERTDADIVAAVDLIVTIFFDGIHNS